LFLEALETRLAPAVIAWTGGGDGMSWTDPLNWGGTAPGMSDDAAINVPGLTVVVAGGNIVVQSVTSQANLKMTSGTFEVTTGASSITGTLTISPNVSLTADGFGTTFTATGTTTADGASIYATGGATLALPGLTHDSATFNQTLQANGPGSVLDLSNLNTLAVTTYSITVQALAGGTVNLSGLTGINVGSVTLEADGTNSKLNLPQLAAFGDPSAASTLQATNAGNVQAPLLTTLRSVTVMVDDTGMLPIAQMQSVTSSSNLAIAGGSWTFSSLTNFDTSSVHVSGAGAAAFPMLTSYTGGSNDVLQATSPGSLLDLSHVTTFVGGSNSYVQALDGAHVNLSAVPGITVASTLLEADGPSSVLDLSLLATQGDPSINSYLQATNGGKVQAPALTSLRNVTVTLDATGILATAQLHSITNSSNIAVTGGAWTFPGLTSLDTSSVRVSGAGTASFAALTHYMAGSFQALVATDPGSVLDLSHLMTFVGGNSNSTYVQALAGGKVDLSGVAAINVGASFLEADGAGSVLDVSLLATQGDPNYSSGLQATNGGNVKAPVLSSLRAVTVTLNASGILPTAQFQTITNGSGIAISGGTWTFPGVTNLDTSSVQVSGAGTVSFAGLTHYMGGSFQILSASDPGSLLDLSHLLTFVGGNSNAAYIQALAGGKVNLSNVAGISVGTTLLEADGPGSVLDVSLLATEGDPNYSSYLQATNGGNVKAPVLNSLRSVNVTVDATSILPTAQFLIIINSSSITMSGGIWTFSALTNLDTSSVYVGGGATAAFPALTHYSGGGFQVLRASDPGSVLDLSHITTYVGGNANPAYVQALAGGLVNFSGVTSAGVGRTYLQADGTGSILNASLLAVLGDPAYANGLQATNGGTVQVNSHLTVTQTSVTFDSSSKLQVSILDLENGSTLSATGTLTGSMINGGTVYPAGSGAPGKLTVTGTYTQTAAGTLALDLFGATPATQFDQLVVQGNASLAGVLAVTLQNGYVPNLGDSFAILSASAVSGGFASATGLQVSATLELDPAYLPAAVTLTAAHPDGPRVTSAVPTGPVSTSLDHFTITFNKPITLSSVTTNDVTLVGPLGPVPINPAMLLAPASLLISFPAQVVTGDYVLSVGPNVTDLPGNAMDQNSNGISGEPTDVFTQTVHLVNNNAPTVIVLTPQGPINHDVSSVQITFSLPMQASSINSGDVTILTPSGPIAAGMVNISQVNNQTFTVSFPDQTAAGTYTVTVGPGATDLSGIALGGTGFQGTFTIDYTGPAVSNMTPTGLQSNPVFEVDVAFSKPINAATFTTSQIVFTGPAGPITVNAPTLISGNSYRITFPGQTTNGVYTLTIGPGVMDLAGNAMDQDADGMNGDSGDAFTGNFNLVLSTATHFAVSAPSTVTAGTAFNFTVTALDASNNLDTHYTGMVHFTSTDSIASLQGNMPLTNGVGTFSATLNTPGAQTITATDTVFPGLTGTSDIVTVGTGSRTHVAFLTQPGTTTAGAAISPALQVAVEDAANHIVSGDNSSVTLALGSNPGSGTLSGTLTVAAVNGVATFSNLSLDKAGNGYTLTAADGVLNGAISSAFDIVVGTAAQVVFTSQPPSTTAGALLAPSVQVAVEDAAGNVLTTDNSLVTLALGSNPGSGTLAGTTTVAATSGIANFSTLSINKPGTSYTLTAADGSLTAATSSAFNIVAGPLDHFQVTASPASITAGGLFLLVVTAQDVLGNTVSSYDGTVHFTSSDPLEPSPAIDTALSGGLGYAAGTLQTVGSWTVRARDSMVSTRTGLSNSVTVSPAGATHFQVGAVPTAITGAPFSVVVTAEDAYNNVVPSYMGHVTLTSTDGAAMLTPSPYDFMAGDAGVHTFTATLNTAGSQTISASDTTGNAGTSPAITVRGLTVQSLTVTPTGFVAVFDKAFNLTTLNLYDGGAHPLAPADVTVVGSFGALTGSLLVDSAAHSITWVNTFGLLPDDTYTVTLGSGADAFKDLAGVPLDGNNDGVPGDSYSTIFNTTFNAASVGLAVSSFARGPAQGVNLVIPGNSTSSYGGIPVQLTDGNNATTAAFTLSYNTALLNVTGAIVDTSGNPQGTVGSYATGPAGSTFTRTSHTVVSGIATDVFAFSTNGQGNLDSGNGPVVLGELTAIIPNASGQTIYGAKQILHVSGVSTNGSLAAVGVDGFQLVAFPGDASGDAQLAGNDGSLAGRVAGGLDTGFAAYPLVDPILVADVAGDGVVSANDASQILQKSVNRPVPNIPSIPAGAQVLPTTAPDPALSIPLGLRVAPDGTLHIPVNLDDARPQGSTGLTEATLALRFDPAVFTVSAADVYLGSIPLSGSGWTLTSVVDQGTGQLAITLYSLTPIATSNGGSLVTIDFHERPGAAQGLPTIELAGEVNPNGQGVYRTNVADTHGAMILTIAPIALSTFLAPVSVTAPAAEPSLTQESVAPSPSLPSSNVGQLAMEAGPSEATTEALSGGSAGFGNASSTLVAGQPGSAIAAQAAGPAIAQASGLPFSWTTLASALGPWVPSPVMHLADVLFVAATRRSVIDLGDLTGVASLSTDALPRLRSGATEWSGAVLAELRGDSTEPAAFDLMAEPRLGRWESLPPAPPQVAPAVSDAAGLIQYFAQVSADQDGLPALEEE
jgi:hypothetical protein